MARIAFLGLGAMGSPIARHLAAAGHAMTVYNRTGAKAEAWVAANGGRIAATPGEAARGHDLVISCVGEDADLEAVTLGPDGAFDAMQAGAVFVDHSTVSVAIARQLAGEARARGFEALDAPVTGNEIGAEKGILSIMCGGSAEAIAAADPVMRAYAARVVHIGEAGAGQGAKAANQIAIAGTLQCMWEAQRFARAAGLDLNKVFEAISGGSAQSWQMDHRWHEIAAETRGFPFAVGWLHKDLALVIDEAERIGTDLPATTLIDRNFAAIEASGGGRKSHEESA